MLVDSEGLWFRVLAARYEVELGRVKEDGVGVVEGDSEDPGWRRWT
jgi:hypothetical protein